MVVTVSGDGVITSVSVTYSVAGAAEEVSVTVVGSPDCTSVLMVGSGVTVVVRGSRPSVLVTVTVADFSVPGTVT